MFVWMILLTILNQNRINKLQKLFSHQFSQNIWRILPHPDEARNEWILELREISEKKVSFALIDLNIPEVRWQVSPQEADWWTSLTAFPDDKVLLHNYRYPDLPEPTDLFCLSAANGSFKWFLPNHVMVAGLSENVIKVASRQAETLKYSTVNSNTGEIIPFYDGNDDAKGVIPYKQPARYETSNALFQDMAGFIDDLIGCGKPICIDYLDLKPYMVFSYYIYEQNLVVQYLLIVSKNKEISLHEQVSLPRDGVGLATMVLKNSTLVYLKNNNEFSSLKLS